jgi:hypothetical protein
MSSQNAEPSGAEPKREGGGGGRGSWKHRNRSLNAGGGPVAGSGGAPDRRGGGAEQNHSLVAGGEPATGSGGAPDRGDGGAERNHSLAAGGGSATGSEGVPNRRGGGGKWQNRRNEAGRGPVQNGGNVVQNQTTNAGMGSDAVGGVAQQNQRAEAGRRPIQNADDAERDEFINDLTNSLEEAFRRVSELEKGRDNSSSSQIKLDQGELKQLLNDLRYTNRTAANKVKLEYDKRLKEFQEREYYNQIINGVLTSALVVCLFQLVRQGWNRW